MVIEFIHLKDDGIQEILNLYINFKNVIILICKIDYSIVLWNTFFNDLSKIVKTMGNLIA